VGRVSHIERTFTTPGTSAYLAHFWLESATLIDAIKRWAAENPSIPGGGATHPASLDVVSVLMRDALKEKKAAEEEYAKAEGAVQKDIPLRDMFPGLQEALAKTKDPFEAMIACSPPGSPQRQMVETLRERARVTGVCVGYTTLADRYAIKSTKEDRVEVAAQLIASLGDRGENYEAARNWLQGYEQRMRTTNQTRPFTKAEALFFHEVMQTLLPLVCLFENPSHFFCDLLPRADPKELQRPALDLMARWGNGVLANPGVLEAYRKEAVKPGFSKVLSKLEKRTPFRGAGGAPGGPSPGVRDYRILATTYYSLPKPERSAWLEKEANQKPFISVASLRRQLSKNRVK
jgi:hypothetical protein